METHLIEEDRRRHRAYRQWQSGPLNLGVDSEEPELVRAAFDGGWKARSKLVHRLILDADEEKARAEDITSKIAAIVRDVTVEDVDRLIAIGKLVGVPAPEEYSSPIVMGEDAIEPIAAEEAPR